MSHHQGCSPQSTLISLANPTPASSYVHISCPNTASVAMVLKGFSGHNGIYSTATQLIQLKFLAILLLSQFSS